MQFIRNHFLATALTCVGVLVFTTWAISLMNASDSTPANADADWKKVQIFRNPGQVKNLPRIGTASVSISLPGTNFNSTALRQAATAQIKQEAAHVNASIVLIETDQLSLTPTPHILLIGGEYKSNQPFRVIAGFVHEVVKSPRTYLPFFLVLSIIVISWAALCLCSFISLRTSTRRLKLWWGLPPLLFGIIGVLAQFPVRLEAEGESLHFDVRWLFVVPVLLGIFSLVRHRPPKDKVTT